MAENKKGFLMYADQLAIVEKLVKKDREKGTNNAGELFFHLMQYVNDENPEPVNDIVDISFEPIKQQLKRDLKSWEKKSVKNSETGRIGGLKSAEARRSKMNQNEANASNVKRNEHDTVNVNVNDTVNVNATVNVKKKKEKTIVVKDVAAPLSEYSLCVDFWLKEFHPGWTFTGQHGKAMKSVLSKLKAIIKDGSPPPEVFKTVCQNLPEWYKMKDLPVIDSKFNEIITEIKNNRNGTGKTNEHPLAKVHRESREILGNVGTNFAASGS